MEPKPELTLVLLLAAAAATIALVTDLRARRIPNLLSACTFLTGVGINVVQGGAMGAGYALAGAGLGLALLLPLYAIRAMGAGDVKLVVALGALLGPRALASVAVYAALVGGLIAVVILARRRRLMFTLAEMFVQHVPPSRSGATAPYAVAIAGGVYLSIVLPPVIG
jgi:prepilin peptidase CpaA